MLHLSMYPTAFRLLLVPQSNFALKKSKFMKIVTFSLHHLAILFSINIPLTQCEWALLKLQR